MDYEETLYLLSIAADALQPGLHPLLAKRNLRRINFQRHQYFMLYRINGHVAEVVTVAHFKEDLKNVLR